MLDKQRINFIILDIEKYLKKLEKMNLKKIEDLQNETIFLASSMIVFQILNRTIDLGDEIIRGNKLGYPIDTKDIFNMLKNEKVINEPQSRILKEFVTFRNKFGHRYGQLEKKEIINFIEKDRQEINKFIDSAIKYIQKEK